MDGEMYCILCVRSVVMVMGKENHIDSLVPEGQYTRSC